MSLIFKEIPLGVRCLQMFTNCCCPRLRINREWCYRSSILFLTYIAYMCYHLSRKPISVVKTVLHQNCSSLPTPVNVPNSNSTWCDWAPFDGSDSEATTLLGTLDSAFLFAYAIAMFASGFIAERVHLRYFLTFGMLFSGLASYLFGIGKTYDIHNYGYYVIVQIFGGVMQTTGWPGVVTIVGNWFGKAKRGLIFGIWNSHTSIGNILGTLIAGKYVETDWSLSFVYPGLIIGVAGFLLFVFLVVSPTDVGILPSNSKKKRPKKRLSEKSENTVVNRDVTINAATHRYDDDAEILIESEDKDAHLAHLQLRYSDAESQRQRYTERSHLLPAGGGASSSSGDSGSAHDADSAHVTADGEERGSAPEGRAIGFWAACTLPGVMEYSLSLFFSKLVSYTFLYWLPLFVKSSTTMGATWSADVSTLFDVGGIFGAIAAGCVSDYSGMSASTCVVMLLLAAPMMLIYQQFCTVNLWVNMMLLMVVGFLVNGPYALITTAVSAELGTHPTLDGSSKALATVTAIIDGTGSIGAAVGPLLAGYVSTFGWESVFRMLIVSDLLALVLLLRLAKQEMGERRRWRNRHNSIMTTTTTTNKRQIRIE